MYDLLEINLPATMYIFCWKPIFYVFPAKQYEDNVSVTL